jgi:formylglycine-generating enzyme required for sulfatase activity
VKDKMRTHVANMLIVKPERDNRQVGDMPFVFVKGKDALPSFWMGMTEVRFGQFANFVKQSGYKAQGTWEKYYKPAYDYYPVVHVTWDDCVAYVEWFSKKFKVNVALPSLAQWQYAAGGRFGTTYPWGNDWDPSYCQSAASTAPDVLPLQGEAGPVQELFFLNDVTLDGVKMMAGNVSEWCSDHGKSADGSTDLAASAGGSWRVSRPKYFTAGYSQMKPVTTEEEDQGFRVVMPAE